MVNDPINNPIKERTMKHYDYIIVGSGVAGLSVALAAAQGGQRSLIITKSALEESNTRYAQGGIAAAVAESDSPKSHLLDTLEAGAGLCDPTAVEALTTDAPGRIAELVRLGMPFDREEANGQLELGREGAHSANRILHAGGDATGKYLWQTLAAASYESPLIEHLEQHLAIELIQESVKGRVIGVKLLPENGLEPAFDVTGDFIVLATGGAGQIYRYTTNPSLTTGDGLALAWRAGALLADMEFFQFHPTALNLPGVPPFLLSEALRGDGAILRNAEGEAFMHRYDPRRELASRDIVARSIATELHRTGAVYLDVRHLGEPTLRRRFPSIYDFCLESGLDIAKDLIPVAPAAHYFMGGILTGRWGETTLPGLYACGEVAATGVHGANRLASNSLLEGLVFGQRLYDYTAHGSTQALDLTTYQHSSPLPLVEYVLNDPATNPDAELPTVEKLQQLMWEKAGLVRDGESLRNAYAQLENWEAALKTTAPYITEAALELASMVTVGRLITWAALLRKESRGAHYRVDFPTTQPEWQCRIILKLA
jgi:L-aspartate oxidase